MTENELNQLIEKLRNHFEPKTEYVDIKSIKSLSMDNISEMTQITFIENGVRVFYKSVNGEWVKMR